MTVQNLHTLDLSDELQQTIKQALATVEDTVGQYALTVAQRRRIVKMGPRSESFCSQTLGAMANHRRGAGQHQRQAGTGRRQHGTGEAG